jgi:sugar phosphate isomerase/epimerase
MWGRIESKIMMTQGMKFALNTSTIRECGLSLEEKIEITARAGYHGIELWLSEIEEFLEMGGTLDDLARSLERHDLQIPNIIAFFEWANPEPRIRAKALEEAQRVLSIARQIGCGCVAAPPAGIRDMEGLPPERIARYYSELLDSCRSTGVKPLLEFWGHSKVLRSLGEALQILEIVDDPDASILVDVFHMAKAGDSFELLKNIDGDRVGLVHMNDYPKGRPVTGMKDEERVYPGDGAAPFDLITASLRDMDYRGFYSLELFNPEYQRAGATEVSRTGIAKMREVFAP